MAKQKNMIHRRHARKVATDQRALEFESWTPEERANIMQANKEAYDAKKSVPS